MSVLGRVYRDSLALVNDLYQLTMAYAHWKEGTAEREAAFHLSFRRNPFGGGFAVACGLALAVEYVENLRFRDDDLDYLATLQGNDGAPLFERGFLEHLRGLSFRCDLDAARGDGGLRPGTAVAGDRPYHGGPASGDAATESGEFSDAGRHQGGAAALVNPHRYPVGLEQRGTSTSRRG